jgi:hypothetical protein
MDSAIYEAIDKQSALIAEFLQQKLEAKDVAIKAREIWNEALGKLMRRK